MREIIYKIRVIVPWASAMHTAVHLFLPWGHLSQGPLVSESLLSMHVTDRKSDINPVVSEVERNELETE